MRVTDLLLHPSRVVIPQASDLMVLRFGGLAWTQEAPVKRTAPQQLLSGVLASLLRALASGLWAQAVRLRLLADT